MIRFIKIFLAALLLAAVFPFGAYGQAASDTLTFYQSDTLRVEAIHLNVSSMNAPLSLKMKTRTMRQITGSASSSLSVITRSLPGIWVSNRHNAALGNRMIIRGMGWRATFGVRGIQVVLDGIPLTVADGQSITNIIDPAFITHVELIRGPAASYWGNSSGGVLYLSTRPDYSSKQNFGLRLSGGSYHNRKTDFRFHQLHDNYKISGYTSYDYNGGYRNYSASKMLRSGIRGSYRFADQSRLEYRGALLWMPQAHNPSALTAGQVEENPRQANQSYIKAESGKQTTQGQAGLSYYRPTSAGLFTVSGYGIYRDLANPLPYAIITIGRFAGGLRSSLDKTIGNWDMKIGGELKFQHDNRVEYENNNGSRGTPSVNQLERVSDQALYLTAKYSPGAFSVLGSLRYDRLPFSTDSAASNRVGKRVFHAFSPALGVSYHPGPLSVYANLSTSFEAPTTTELVNRPGNGNGFNPSLKPEHTLSLDIGSRGSAFHHFLEYDLSLYQLWIRNLLFPYQLKANGPTYYRNQGKTHHKGINVSAEIHPLDDLSFRTAYTLTDATFIKAQTLSGELLKGKSVPGVAEHRVSASLRWLPEPFWLELRGQFVSAYPVNNLNTAGNDRYFTADFKFSYQKLFSGSGVVLIPFININNIFDARYSGSVVVNASGGRYYEPAPGRNWQAGISMRF
jgi:iron complex outermembrane receptor protein